MKYQIEDICFKVKMIVIPVLIWLVLIFIGSKYGSKAVYFFVFYILLGLLFAFNSFVCAFYYFKVDNCSKIMKSTLENSKTLNERQQEIEQMRLEGTNKECRIFEKRFHNASQMVYLVQGTFAILVIIEFFLGWNFN